MKGMIFAAGFGTRLGELTKQAPKCLVKLSNGITMLEHVILRFKAAGVKEIIINTHYLADQIKDFIELKKFPLDIQFSHEDTILGTGGGLKKARWFFDGNPFLVHNSDVYSDIDLKSLINSHKKNNPVATLAVMKRETSRPLIFDKSLRLTGFGKEPNIQKISSSSDITNKFGFCGIQIISPSFFTYLDQFEGEFSTIPAFFSAAKQGETVLAYKVKETSKWIDMGTPDDLAKLNSLLSN
jgi:MurNAc alpha-1-phosphate uridylyltransferase